MSTLRWIPASKFCRGPGGSGRAREEPDLERMVDGYIEAMYSTNSRDGEEEEAGRFEGGAELSWSAEHACRVICRRFLATHVSEIKLPEGRGGGLYCVITYSPPVLVSQLLLEDEKNGGHRQGFWRRVGQLIWFVSQGHGIGFGDDDEYEDDNFEVYSLAAECVGGEETWGDEEGRVHIHSIPSWRVRRGDGQEV